jgi:hypothetical protein
LLNKFDTNLNPTRHPAKQGLEWARYALGRLWIGAAQPPLLRGHDVTAAFEAALSALPKRAKRRLRYYRRFMPPGGLPLGEVPLYGAYAPTEHDEDLEFHVGLARAGAPGALAAAGAPGSGWADALAAGGDELSPAAADGAARAGAAFAAAAARVAALGPARVAALLDGPDPHAAAREVLGVRLFLGGVSHGEYQAWRAGLEGGEEEESEEEAKEEGEEELNGGGDSGGERGLR